MALDLHTGQQSTSKEEGTDWWVKQAQLSTHTSCCRAIGSGHSGKGALRRALRTPSTVRNWKTARVHGGWWATHKRFQQRKVAPDDGEVLLQDLLARSEHHE